jgi:ribosomal protein L11 methyltransferase
MIVFWRIFFILPKTVAPQILQGIEDIFEPCSIAVGELAEGKEPQKDSEPVELLFQEKPDLDHIRLYLTSQGLDPQVPIQVTEIPDQDWVTASLRDLKPLQIGSFWIYGAHCQPKASAGTINLEVDAGLAFGTGHHETTTGCLLALEHLKKFFNPQTILDVGTGTGILAMAAHRLWSGSECVLASDIDNLAVRVTRENVRKNKMTGKIKAFTAAGVRHNTLQHNAPYDLLIANILARPLVSLAVDLSGLLKTGGFIVLSGLLTRQVNYVRSAYRLQGIDTFKVIPMGEWSTLILHKRA